MVTTITSFSRPTTEDLLLQREIEAFFYAEAELLDSRRFEDWLKLFHDDVHYWMPIACNFQFGQFEEEYTRPGRDLNWFDEGKFELEQRVKQIMGGDHWAEEPLSRTSHLVTNIQITGKGEDWVETRCRFLVYRNRTEAETEIFVGKRNDRLVHAENGGWLIKHRHIFLDQAVLLAKNLAIFF